MSSKVELVVGGDLIPEHFTRLLEAISDLSSCSSKLADIRSADDHLHFSPLGLDCCNTLKAKLRVFGLHYRVFEVGNPIGIVRYSSPNVSEDFWSFYDFSTEDVLIPSIIVRKLGFESLCSYTMPDLPPFRLVDRYYVENNGGTHFGPYWTESKATEVADREKGKIIKVFWDWVSEWQQKKKSV
jgi:hypothetical protein